MRRLIAALFAAAVLFIATPAMAQGTNDNSFSGSFEALDQELVNLEASLSESSEKADKKRLKAVKKARKAIAKEADDLGDDMKTAGKVAKAIEKGFKDEFLALRVSEAAEDLPGLLLDLIDDLRQLLQANLQDLNAALDGLTAKGQKKVQKALDKADAVLDNVGEDFVSKIAKAYSKAYKSWAKGQKAVDKDPGPDLGFTVKINGKKKNDAGEVNFLYTPQTGLLVAQGANLDLGGYNISFTPVTVNGTGTFALSTGSVLIISLPPDNYTLNSGSVTITALDTESRRIAGTFEFTVDGVLPTTGSLTISGTFDVVYENGGI